MFIKHMLELFAIANYGITRWPSFHGSIRNMESTLRWLCSSAPESAGLRYDKTLDGTNTWRLPPLQSTGDRLAAVRYGLEHAPSAEDAVQDRGPIFIPRPYQAFRRDTEKELARIKRLQQMAKQKLYVLSADSRHIVLTSPPLVRTAKKCVRVGELTFSVSQVFTNASQTSTK